MKKRKKRQEKGIGKLIPVTGYDEEQKCFLYQDGSCMDLCRINTKDLTNANVDEIEMDCFRWAKYHKLNAGDLKLIFMKFPCSTARQQRYWRDKVARNRNPLFTEMLEKKCEELAWREKHIYAKEFYLMLFAENGDKLRESRRQMDAVLQTGRGGMVSEIPREKKEQILFKLANKNSLVFPEREHDGKLLERIAPAGNLLPQYGCVRTGTGYEACIHVYKMPEGLDDYWMTKLDRFENTITTIDMHTEDVVEVKKNLNKAIDEQKVRKNAAADYQEYYDAEARELEMKRLYDEISSMGEVVKTLQIRIFTVAGTQEELERRVESTISRLEADSFRAAVFLNEEEQEWRSIYLSDTEQRKAPHSITKGNPFEAKLIAAGNPFHFSSLEDPFGGFLGYTACNGNVLFDTFFRSDTRVNYSAAITGKQRFGKSTLLKKQLKERTIRGDYTRVFDITGEFSPLVRKLGGRVLSSDGSDGIINLLEIFAAGDNDHTNYSQHWAKLKTSYLFMKPDASTEEIDVYHEMVELLYERYGLLPARGKKITGLPAKQYPRFTDLYNLILEQMQELVKGEYSEMERHLTEEKLKHLNNVKNQIGSLISTYGYLFDGWTSLDNMTDVQTVSYDLTTLKDLDPAIFDMQIYNLLSMCWSGLVINGRLMKQMWESGTVREEDIVHFLILMDEAHRYINTRKLFVLQYVSTYLRECPKYFGAIWLASQSIRDYTPEMESGEGVNLLKNIFELTQYKFIFNQDSNVLPVLDRVFNNALTYAQRARIPLLQRGETVLCIAGEENIEFKVYLSKEDEKLFAGGA